MKCYHWSPMGKPTGNCSATVDEPSIWVNGIPTMAVGGTQQSASIMELSQWSSSNQWTAGAYGEVITISKPQSVTRRDVRMTLPISGGAAPGGVLVDSYSPAFKVDNLDRKWLLTIAESLISTLYGWFVPVRTIINHRISAVCSKGLHLERWLVAPSSCSMIPPVTLWYIYGMGSTIEQWLVVKSTS